MTVGFLGSAHLHAGPDISFQLQMFISCGGIKVLVELMDDNYQERKDLVWMALDGILQVFELQVRRITRRLCVSPFAHSLLEDPNTQKRFLSDVR